MHNYYNVEMIYKSSENYIIGKQDEKSQCMTPICDNDYNMMY